MLKFVHLHSFLGYILYFLSLQNVLCILKSHNNGNITNLPNHNQLSFLSLGFLKNACNGLLNHNTSHIFDRRLYSVPPENEAVRVRFAPSPTGNIHMGSIRTYLYNFLFARGNGGTLILRIDDTDSTRLNKDSEDDITGSIRWLGLPWDEGVEIGGEYGPYHQSKRMNIYRDLANKLVDENKAYYCFCSKEEVEAEKEKVLKQGGYYRYDKKCSYLDKDTVDLYIAQGKAYATRLRSLKPEDDDIVLLRSTGAATFNFACAVDDSLMHISHVIRGMDHISNTEKQERIIDALGYKPPIYVHCSLLTDNNRDKISKRITHFSTASEIRRQGICVLPLINYLARLGTGNSDIKTCEPLKELADRFSLDYIKSTSIAFDIDKLLWLNRQYLSSISGAAFVRELKPYLEYIGYHNNLYPIDKLFPFVEECYGYFTNCIHTLKEFMELLIKTLNYPLDDVYTAVFKGNFYLALCDLQGEYEEDLVQDRKFLRWFTTHALELVSVGIIDDGYSALEKLILNKSFPEDVRCAHPLRLVRLSLTGSETGLPLLDLFKLWQIAENYDFPNFVNLEERLTLMRDKIAEVIERTF